MIFFAVFLLSLSSLAFEVLLVRVFSISQWNYLGFMVISLALFGFAASGTFLSIIDIRKKRLETRLSNVSLVPIAIILFAVTAVASFIILNLIPLDYFRVPLEIIQVVYLLLVYFFLALPFFFAGLVISLAYIFIPEKTGFIYFSNMVGSACGAVLPVPLLPILGEGKLIILAALIPLVYLPFEKLWQTKKKGFVKLYSRKKKVTYAAFGFSIVLIMVVIIFWGENFIPNVNPSPYKALSQILQFPHTQIEETVSSLRGRIDIVRSPYIRFAPGLSLKYTDRLPSQWAAYLDGDTPFILYDLSKQNKKRFSEFTLSFAGYCLTPDPEYVLMIQHGGGTGIPCALASGARQITVVEQNPQIAQIIQRHYKLPVVIQNPRTFLAQSEKLFDVIHLENWGTSLPGSAALTQEYMFTKEAFTGYLNHLTGKGVLIISRKLLLPPSDTIRLWATAYEALKFHGIQDPGDHIAMLRNWDSFTLIISSKPIQHNEVIKNFSQNLNFDILYLRGMDKASANQFNVFDDPYHFLEINRLEQAYREGKEKVFFQQYHLQVMPQTDQHPFPYKVFKWSKLTSLYKSTGSRPYTLLLSGEIIIAIVFIETFLIAFLLLLIPIFIIAKRENMPPLSSIIYFLAVGAGFIFVELFFIKEYTLLFGDPVISFTVVLTGILVFSGIGGILSGWIRGRCFKYAIIALIVVLSMWLLGIDKLTHWILGFPNGYRYFIAFALLVPPGILMGLPFPLGMQLLLKRPVDRAYAWAVNGSASILCAVVSAQIALSMGIPIIMVCAIAAYLVVLVITLTY